MGRRLGHVPALDGLRGIAILLVIAAHSSRHLPWGRLGVDLFFVLSGFLITALLLDEWETNGSASIRAFYGRRIRRLLPALGLMIVAYLGVVAALVSWGRIRSDYMDKALEDSLFGVWYVSNLSRAYFDGMHGGELGHLWSLAQEEQFYAVWPLLLVALLAHRVPVRGIAVGLGALAFVLMVYRGALLGLGGSFWRVWYGPDTHADPIVLGCLAGVVYARGLIHRVSPSITVALVAVAALSVSGLGLPRAWILAVGLPAFSLATVAVILRITLYPSSWATRLLELRPLRGIGKISYGLYLWHVPLIVGLGWKLGVPLAVVAALLSYQFVERPVLDRAGRRRSERAGDDLPAATVPVGAT